MGASYGKLDPGHEEAIYQLKKAAKSGREIRELLARGYEKLAPVSISASRANSIARRILDERDELYKSRIQDRPAGEALRLLTRRLLLIAERETERLESHQRAGRLDAARLGRLAGAVTKLHPLLDANEAARPLGQGSAAQKGDSSEPNAPASAFASTLIGEGEAVPEPPAPPPGQGAQPSGALLADRVVPAPPPIVDAVNTHP